MWIIYVLIIVLVLAILYTRYKPNNACEKCVHADLRKYLLGEYTLQNIGKVTKPILWIHVPLEYNSRKWESFGSRSSFELNQPYLHLTCQTIIHKCQDSFHIVIFDDTCFSKLLPDWKYPSRHMSNVCRINGFLRLLYTYGGMITPISFVCFRDLIELYTKGIRNNKMFVCENVNYETIYNHNFMPDTDFMGAAKGNQTVLELSTYIIQNILAEFSYTEPTNCKIGDWILSAISENRINIIHGYDVGIMDKDENPILLDDMMSYNYINIDTSTAYGIWIPNRQILKRFKYQWFARLSEGQIEESKMIICKYIIHSYITDRNRDMYTQSTKYSDQPPVVPTKIQSLVHFWDTPLYKGLYGLKPIYLGDTVLTTQENV